MAIEGLSIRLYFDHHVREWFARDLRRRGYRVVEARDLDAERASDEEHLAWAADHGFVLLTHDLKDYQRIVDRWLLEKRSHAGLILSVQPNQTPYAELLRRLLHLLNNLTAEEMVDRVEWLDSRWSPPDSDDNG